MDELNRIAGVYFNAFEGRRHYPSLWSWQWAVCAATFALWMLSIWHYFDDLRRADALSLIVTLVAELAFILATIVIENYKRRSLLSSRSAVGVSTAVQLDAMRTDYLVKTFSRGPEQFASLANELMTLVALSERLRSRSGTVLARVWRHVYDRDHKDRLVGIAVGAAAILVSLVVVGLPPEYPSVIELVAYNKVTDYLYLVFTVTAVLFGLWTAVTLALRNVLEMSSFWAARLAKETSFSHMKVRYMMLDLVRLHRMQSVKVQPRRLPRQPQEARVRRRPTG